jgi:hypothetical protein
MKILIVGAGPTGLILAYWLISRGHVITMYEGRPFIRGQIIYLLPEFYRLLPPSVREKLNIEGGCQKKDSSLICYQQGKWIEVHISLFQLYLLEYLTSPSLSKSFTLIHHFASIEDIAKHPEKVVIIADGGGRSGLLRRLFHHPYRSLHVANSAVITYEGKLDGQCKASLRKFHELIQGQHAFIIHRALPDYGHFGIQLSDQSYRLLQSLPEGKRLDAFFKLPEGDVAEKVMKIAGYKEVKRKVIGVFPIDLRTAERFFFQQFGKSFFVVGDAAFTTHFFSGLGINRGLMCAQQLVKLLSRSSDRWPKYHTKVVKIRDQLWREAVPPHLVDMSEIVQDCQKRGLDGKCIIVKSKTHPDRRRIKKIFRKELKTESSLTSIKPKNS